MSDLSLYLAYAMQSIELLAFAYVPSNIYHFLKHRLAPYI